MVRGRNCCGTHACSNAGAESAPLTAWLTQPGAAMWCYMTAAQDSHLGCTWRQKPYMNELGTKDEH